MSTTGNLYLQVYNKGLNKYQELESGILPISIAAISYDTGSYIPFSFTGVYIPKFVTDNIFAFPINIGKFNLGPVSKGTESIQIGVNNFVFTSTGILPSGITFSQPIINIGASNFSSGIEIINLGHENIVDFGYYIYNLGKSNTFKKSISNYVLGTQNNISGSYELDIFGRNNYFKKDSSLPNNQSDLNFTTVVGNSNISVSGLSLSTVVGDNNSLNGNTQLILFGRSNLLDRNGNIYIIGKTNDLFNSYNTDVYGSANILNTVSGGFYVGLANQDLNSDFNKVFGQNNALSGSNGNTIFGDVNNLNGANANIIYGYSNQFLSDVSGVFNNWTSEANIVFGNSNSVFGSNNNIYVGKDNVTYSGQENVFVGIDNEVSGDQLSFYFGKSNVGLANESSYIFGQGNFISGSNNGFTFGSDNTNLGTQNYIIGNNNSVRSGDYNSILIGISHEFTGEYKTASVNIASIDSIIEVSPSDIKLKSLNRVKFNDENIVINSDLSSYLTPNNGLINTGIFTGTSAIFQDPTYVGLPNRIQLGTFLYSGNGDKYYGAFSGSGFADPTNSFFSGFLWKRSTSYYNNQSPPTTALGNFYYESNDKVFAAIFTKYLEPVDGNWVIVKNYPYVFENILFTNSSTDTGVFPTSNWKTYGYDFGDPYGIIYTGYAPAPVFEYNGGSFTGVFQTEVLENTSLALDNFNSYGSKRYISSQGFAVIYGNHKEPQFNPTWLIVDNYSSGVYYRNDSYTVEDIPQYNWISTGFFGSTGTLNEGFNPSPFSPISIALNTQKTGFISSYDPTLGKIYIPFYY